jgi:5'-nucleotidase
MDFSAAAYFTKLFAQKLLEKKLSSEEVDLLKVDVPSDATKATAWQITRLSRLRYYEPIPPERSSWNQPAKAGYKESASLENEKEDTDVFIMRRKRLISVTPLSLDMTARVDLAEFEKQLRD